MIDERLACNRNQEENIRESIKKYILIIKQSSDSISVAFLIEALRLHSLVSSGPKSNQIKSNQIKSNQAAKQDPE